MAKTYAALEAGQKRKGKLAELMQVHEFNVLLVLVLIFIALSIFTQAFFTVDNILNVLNQSAITFIMAVGMTLVIVLGGIDLSIGAVMSLSGIVCCSLMTTSGLPIWAAILITLAIGMLFGLITGLIIGKLGIVDFIATLAMMLICHGITYTWTGGYPLFNLPSDFMFFGQGKVLGIRFPIYIAAVVFIIFNILMSRYKLGTKLYATGGNKEAARLSGINVDKIRIFAYVISSVCGAVAGVLMASRLGTGQPNAGDSYTFDVIGGVILGGTSPFGGVGKIYGTLIGVLILAFITNGLTILNINYFMQEIVKGIVILIALAVNSYRAKQLAK